eukprot:tig00000403_g320.t1
MGLFKKKRKGGGGGGPAVLVNPATLSSVRTISNTNYRIILAFINVANLGLSLAVIGVFGRFYSQSAWLGLPSFLSLVFTVSPLNSIFSIHALVWIATAVSSVTHRAVSIALGLVAFTLTTVHFGLSFYFNDNWRAWVSDLNDSFPNLSARFELAEDNVYRLVSLVVVEWIASLLALAAVLYLRCEAQDEKRGAGPRAREAAFDALASDLRGLLEDRFRAAMAGVDRVERSMLDKEKGAAGASDIRALTAAMDALQKEVRAGRSPSRRAAAAEEEAAEVPAPGELGGSPEGRRGESDGGESAGSGGRRRRRRSKGKKKGRSGRRSEGELDEADAPRRQWQPQRDYGVSSRGAPPSLYSYAAPPPAPAMRPGFYYYPPAVVAGTALAPPHMNMSSGFEGGGSPLSPRKPDALPSPRASGRYGSPEGRPASRALPRPRAGPRPDPAASPRPDSPAGPTPPPGRAGWPRRTGAPGSAPRRGA